MTLNKRYKRNIKENLSFYIAASILTIVALLLFYLFYIAGVGIKSYGDNFFVDNNLEDATFSTYLEIPDDKIADIESKYNVTFEKEHFTNINEADYKVRLFKANKKIDLYEVIDGRDISSNDEIVISKGYAVNNNVGIGDKIAIRGKDYTVTGYFLRPDYLYMLENTDDSYKNITSFFLAYMTDEAYDEINSSSCQYKVIYGDDTDKSQFRKDMNDSYKMSEYLSKEDNQRITMVDDQAMMFIVMAYVFLVTIPLITVALISIIIGRKIKSEQKLIGTLSALGYKKKQLMWHYAVLAMIPGLVGGMLVSVITKLIQQPYGELSLADYEPMPVKFVLPLYIALLGIIVPMLIYMLEAMHKVNKLLKKDTVAMLNGTADESKIKRVMVGKKGKVRNKFAIRSILANPGRSLVVFLGAFLGALMITVAFMFIDSLNNLIDTGSENMGSFKYEYILNRLEDKDIENVSLADVDKLVIGRYEYNDSTFMIIGTDSDVKYLNIDTTDGNRADLNDGFYITNVMAYSYGCKAGDDFTFVNPTTMEEKTVKVAGVISNNSQKFIVCSQENARELLGWKADTYNGLLSEKALNLGDKISKTVTSEDIKEQMNTILDEMNSIIYSLAVIGTIICAAALYVSVNMLVSENRHNISMLKVLGFKSREINSMVLDVNHIIIPVGILIGIAGGYGMMVSVFKIYSGIEGVLYEPYISLKSIILTVLIVVCCYALSLLVVRRKAEKVDMVESLKDNRE